MVLLGCLLAIATIHATVAADYDTRRAWSKRIKSPPIPASYCRTGWWLYVRYGENSPRWQTRCIAAVRW
jgi:hypothetical protein